MNQCPQCENEISDTSKYCLYCGFDLKITSVLKADKTNREKRSVIGELTIGTVIGDRFKIIRKIGQGSRGNVYEADDIVLDEKVALKVLYPQFTSDERTIQKFKREIKIARRIKHPNVCNIYDFGIVDDLFFISMELIHGIILSKHLTAGSIPEEEKTSVIIGIVRAMEAAHLENIVHRDLNPSNIMISEEYKPIVMNFGIARYFGQSDFIKVNKGSASYFSCSPFYMSPEHFCGAKVDQRSDIYAFGSIAYELFTGKVPFNADTPVAIGINHMQKQPRSPRELVHTIPESIEKIILNCLEKKPENRFQTAREILTALSVETEVEGEYRSKILIADDDDNIRVLIGTIIEDEGFLPIHAKDGEEAISRALKDKPSLIFMDLLMPVLDGYQAIEFLQSNSTTSDIPIVVISSRIDEEHKAYSKSIGIEDHLIKPIDMENIVSVLRKYL